jgi:hypothetical protein
LGEALAGGYRHRRGRAARLAAAWTLWLCCLCGVEARAAAVRVEVADPYIELRTGPGRGYPVFHVEERGAAVDLLGRKTGWFKVRTARGIEGWVDRAQLERTLDPTGERVQFREPSREDYARRRWELGIMTGEYGEASAISAYGAFAFTPGLLGEAEASQVLGRFSDSWLFDVGLVAQPFPDWRVSPFFALGTGMIDTHARASLVQARDRTDRTSHAGVGVRAWITGRLMARAEYRHYVIFTSRNDNEEVDDWRFGFAVFF